MLPDFPPVARDIGRFVYAVRGVDWSIMPFFQQATHHSPEIEVMPILFDKTAEDWFERPAMGADRVRHVVKCDRFFGLRKSDQLHIIIFCRPADARCQVTGHIFVVVQVISPSFIICIF
ncbi:hypothetical protein SDC9_124161 [bioreactor metagenome]|uniref:Uncharacterized protein n=1 Tax=bioreactor metagenome TaxID=1076179 RepID=A0A645CJP0_9ZZZZ